MMNLAQFINQAGSRSEAARQLGVARMTIKRWERGDFNPSQALMELARQKGVDLSQGRLTPRLDKKPR